MINRGQHLFTGVVRAPQQMVGRHRLRIDQHHTVICAHLLRGRPLRNADLVGHDLVGHRIVLGPADNAAMSQRDRRARSMNSQHLFHRARARDCVRVRIVVHQNQEVAPPLHQLNDLLNSSLCRAPPPGTIAIRQGEHHCW